MKFTDSQTINLVLNYYLFDIRSSRLHSNSQCQKIVISYYDKRGNKVYALVWRTWLR
jgi:hypothetical protein